jgi:hypothetical protein
MVKKILFLLMLLVFLIIANDMFSQCSICTKSAQQLGDTQGKGLNLSILFLAFTPLILIGYIGYKWWKGEKAERL